MAQTCPVCLRSNPDEAAYCCRDGAALGGVADRRGPVAVGSQPFPRPFVFPSGRTCRTFDELTLACETLWTEAVELLRDGVLEAFFSGLGRADLSGAARRFAFEPDLEQGLDQLLAALPGEVREPARLTVQPLEINLGRIGRRADHSFVLHLQNEGMGLLRGSIACSDANWLILGDGDGAPHKVFQCRYDGSVSVRVVGRRVRGGPRGVEGLLLVESNGGSAVVTVRAEVPVLPFADGVLAGADSPRALAVKARAAPREAAPLFESGAVAVWYEANGWTYPVQGPAASGIGAVQQFFEALGLAAPPRVEIAETRLWLEGAPGDALETAVVVQTQDSRPVFAHAVSAAPWLHVGKAVRTGRAARIPLHVPAVPDRPGQRLTGRVEVTANGNQCFTVEVALTVAAARGSRPVRGQGLRAAARPTAASPSHPGLWLWLFAGLFFLAAVGAAATAVAVAVLAPETPNVEQPPPVSKAPPDAPPPPAPAPGRPKDDNTPPEHNLPFQGHTSVIRAAAFTPEGDVLTAGDHTVRRWDGATGREVKRWTVLPGNVEAAAFSADGKLAAVAGPDFVIRLWDLESGRELRTFIGHKSEVYCLAISLDGRRVLSGGADRGVLVWDAETGKQLHRLEGHTSAVYGVAVSVDGRFALSGGGDHAVRLWDVTEGREVRQFPAHDDIVWAAAFSPDGRLALSAGGGDYNDDRSGFTAGARDFDVRLWDAADGREVRRFHGHTDAVGVLAFSPDGGRVLTAGNDLSVRLWRTSDGRPIRRYDGHTDLVRTAAFSPDGRRAVTAGDDKVVRVWDLPPDVADLVKLLERDEPADRLHAVRELASFGPDARAAFPPLMRALKEGDGDFRTEVLATLKRIGPPTRAEAPALGELLADGSFPAGRLYALDELAALGPDARPAAAALCEATKDRDSQAVRRKAAAALARIGPDVRALAFDPLIDLLRDADAETIAAAADALAKLGPVTKADAASLQRLVRDRSEAVRRYALAGLAEVGPDAADAAPLLTEAAAHDGPPELRRLALKALGRVQPAAPRSLDAFTAALADADAGVRREAAAALAEAGTEHGALPGLLRALAADDEAVSKTAEEALKKAQLDRSQAALLGAGLRTKKPAVRLKVLDLLAPLGADAADAVPDLCDVLKDGPGEPRRRAVALLATMGPAAKEARDALLLQLKDDDKAFRLDVAFALAKIGGDAAADAAPVLVSALRIEKLDDMDAAALREKAGLALARIGKPAVKPLTDALEKDFAGGGPGTANGPVNATARLAVLQTLAQIGPAANTFKTLSALSNVRQNDPFPLVREAAKQTWAAVHKEETQP